MGLLTVCLAILFFVMMLCLGVFYIALKVDQIYKLVDIMFEHMYDKPPWFP